MMLPTTALGPSRMVRIMAKQILSVTTPAATRLEQLLSQYRHDTVSQPIHDSLVPQEQQRNSPFVFHQRKPRLNEQQLDPSSTERSRVALKINLQRKGCSGLAYNLRVVGPDEIMDADEVIRINDAVTLVIDAKAVLFLVGSEMDFINQPLGSRFTFNNPNQKSTCGCGKSFTV